MYAGRMVEQGSVADVMAKPLHPYAQGLMGATVHAGNRGTRLTTIPGSPPDLRFPVPGCAFAPRCQYVGEACLEQVPAFRHPVEGRAVRCVKVEEMV